MNGHVWYSESVRWSHRGNWIFWRITERTSPCSWWDGAIRASGLLRKVYFIYITQGQSIITNLHTIRLHRTNIIQLAIIDQALNSLLVFIDWVGTRNVSRVCTVGRSLHVQPMVLAGQLFESLAFRFRDEQGSEDSDEPNLSAKVDQGGITWRKQRFP
jgi:hypothetical protein